MSKQSPRLRLAWKFQREMDDAYRSTMQFHPGSVFDDYDCETGGLARSLVKRSADCKQPLEDVVPESSKK